MCSFKLRKYLHKNVCIADIWSVITFETEVDIKSLLIKIKSCKLVSNSVYPLLNTFNLEDNFYLNTRNLEVSTKMLILLPWNNKNISNIPAKNVLSSLLSSMILFKTFLQESQQTSVRKAIYYDWVPGVDPRGGGRRRTPPPKFLK